MRTLVDDEPVRVCLDQYQNLTIVSLGHNKEPLRSGRAGHPSLGAGQLSVCVSAGRIGGRSARAAFLPGNRQHSFAADELWHLRMIRAKAAQKTEAQTDRQHDRFRGNHATDLFGDDAGSGQAHAKPALIFGHRHPENAGLGEFPDHLRIETAPGITKFSGSVTSARPFKQRARALAQQAKVFLFAGKDISLCHFVFAGSSRGCRSKKRPRPQGFWR